MGLTAVAQTSWKESAIFQGGEGQTRFPDFTSKDPRMGVTRYLNLGLEPAQTIFFFLNRPEMLFGCRHC